MFLLFVSLAIAQFVLLQGKTAEKSCVSRMSKVAIATSVGEVALGSFTREIMRTVDETNNDVARSGNKAVSVLDALRFDQNKNDPYDPMITSTLSTGKSNQTDTDTTPSSGFRSSDVLAFPIRVFSLCFYDCPAALEEEFAVYLTLNRNVPLTACVLEALFVLVNAFSKFILNNALSHLSGFMYAAVALAVIVPALLALLRWRQHTAFRKFQSRGTTSSSGVTAHAPDVAALPAPLFSFRDLFSDPFGLRKVLRNNAHYHEITLALLFIFFAFVEFSVQFFYTYCGVKLIPIERRNQCFNTIGSQGAFVLFLLTNTAVIPMRFVYFATYAVGLFCALIACRWFPGSLAPTISTQLASSISLLGFVLLACLGTVYMQERLTRKGFLSFGALLSKIDEVSLVRDKVARIASSVSSFDLTDFYTTTTKRGAAVTVSFSGSARGAILVHSDATIVASVGFAHQYDSILFAHIAPVDCAILAHSVLCEFDAAKARHLDHLDRFDAIVKKISVAQEGDRYTVFLFTQHGIVNSPDPIGASPRQSFLPADSHAVENGNASEDFVDLAHVMQSALEFLQTAVSGGNRRKQLLLKEMNRRNHNLVRCTAFLGIGDTTAAVAGPHQSASPDSSRAIHIFYRGGVVDLCSRVFRDASQYHPHDVAWTWPPDHRQQIFVTTNTRRFLSKYLACTQIGISTSGAAPPLGLSLRIDAWERVSLDATHRVDLPENLFFVGTVNVSELHDFDDGRRYSLSRTTDGSGGASFSASTGKPLSDTDQSGNPLLSPFEHQTPERLPIGSDVIKLSSRAEEGEKSTLGPIDRWRGVFSDPSVEDHFVLQAQAPFRYGQLLWHGTCVIVFSLVMMFITYQCWIDHFGQLSDEYHDVFFNSTSANHTELNPTDLAYAFQIIPVGKFNILHFALAQSVMGWFLLAGVFGVLIPAAALLSTTTFVRRSWHLQLVKAMVTVVSFASIACFTAGIFSAPFGTLLSNSSSVWVIVIGLLLVVRPAYYSLILMLLPETILVLVFLTREVFFSDRTSQSKILYLVQLPLVWCSFVAVRLLEERNRRHRFSVLSETLTCRQKLQSDLGELEKLLKSFAPDEITANEMARRFQRVAKRKAVLASRQWKQSGDEPHKPENRLTFDDAMSPSPNVEAQTNDNDANDDDAPFLVKPEEYYHAVISCKRVNSSPDSTEDRIDDSIRPCGVRDTVLFHQSVTELLSHARQHTKRHGKCASTYLSCTFSSVDCEAVVVADTPFALTWLVESLAHKYRAASPLEPSALALFCVLGCGSLCGTIAGSYSSGSSSFEFMGEPIKASRLLLSKSLQMNILRSGVMVAFATERFTLRMLALSQVLISRLNHPAPFRDVMLLTLRSGGEPISSDNFLHLECTGRQFVRDGEKPGFLSMAEEELRARLIEDVYLLADALFFLGHGDWNTTTSPLLMEECVRRKVSELIGSKVASSITTSLSNGAGGENCWQTMCTAMDGAGRKKVVGLMLQVDEK